MTPDDALTLRMRISILEAFVRYYEEQGRRNKAVIARRRLEACAKKLAEIEAAAEADAKRGGDDHARFV